MLPTFLRTITYLRFLKLEIPATVVSLYSLGAVMPDGLSSPQWPIALWLGLVAYATSLLHRYLIPQQESSASQDFLQKNKIVLVRSIAISIGAACILIFFIDRPVFFIMIGLALAVYLFFSARYFHQGTQAPWRRLALTILTVTGIWWRHGQLPSPIFFVSGLIILILFLQNTLLLRSPYDSKKLIHAKNAAHWQSLGMKIAIPLIIVAGAWLLYHNPHRMLQRIVLSLILLGLIQGLIFFCRFSLFPSQRILRMLNWILLTPVFIL